MSELSDLKNAIHALPLFVKDMDGEMEIVKDGEHGEWLRADDVYAIVNGKHPPLSLTCSTCGQPQLAHVPSGACAVSPEPSPTLASDFMRLVDNYLSDGLSIRSYQDATQNLLGFIAKHRIDLHQALLRSKGNV